MGPGLFDTAAERQAREDVQSHEDAQSHEDKLLGDQLTAQFKSGLAMRPAKIKPKKAGNLFEDEGPEQGGLFSRREGEELPRFLKPLSERPFDPAAPMAETIGQAQLLYRPERNNLGIVYANRQAIKTLIEVGKGRA